MAGAKTLDRSVGYLPYRATLAFWSEGVQPDDHDRSAPRRGNQATRRLSIAALWPVTSAD
jgi:hypothetical protein